MTTLAEIHDRIDACEHCSIFGDPSFVKIRGLVRGDAAAVMIVGQGPGATEAITQVAFSGQSGTRLDKWLVACGNPEEQPRRGVYLTSLIKCGTNESAQSQTFRKMSAACAHFLGTQIDIIRPQLIVTLGEPAFRALIARDPQDRFAAALCTPRSYDQIISELPLSGVTLLPWPHPSGSNRWLNEAANRVRLEASFHVVGEFLQ